MLTDATPRQTKQGRHVLRDDDGRRYRARTESWNGGFFGPGTTLPATVLPSGVAGEFDATFNNGYVAGAFGAERDELDPPT